MIGLEITKSLAGKDDLLLGRDTQTQERGGHLKVITPINLIQPVYSLSELQTLNPKESDVAFFLGDVAIQDNQGFVKVSQIKEFYVYDFSSEEKEDYPYVIASTVAEVGRWVLCQVGEDRIKAEVEKQVLERTENLANVVLVKVKPQIRQEVEAQVDNAVAILRKQGGVYHKAKEFSYDKNNFITAFVEKEGIVYEKTFMVNDKQEELLTDDPLKGNVFDRANGVTIYQDDEFLEVNPAYIEVMTRSRLLTPRYKTNKMTSYQIYNDTTNPNGILKVRLFSNNSVTASFEVVFCGMSYKDFTLQNVVYSQNIKTFSTTTQESSIFFPLFAITANSVYFGLSVEDTRFCDSFEMDYTDIDTKPMCVETQFEKTQCYSIRPNGGSYITNIGEILTNVKQYENNNFCSSDFYLFMQGALPYSEEVEIPTAYHLYKNARCLAMLPDNRKSHFISVGVGTPHLGEVQQPALPNIKWKGQLSSTIQYVSNVTPNNKKRYQENTITSATATWGINQDKSTVQSPYDYNAGRDCSNIYQDGETTVKTLSIYVNRLIVVH